MNLLKSEITLQSVSFEFLFELRFFALIDNIKNVISKINFASYFKNKYIENKLVLPDAN